jgi:hypothetical protein
VVRVKKLVTVIRIARGSCDESGLAHRLHSGRACWPQACDECSFQLRTRKSLD